jgi:hypothetical protein
VELDFGFQDGAAIVIARAVVMGQEQLFASMNKTKTLRTAMTTG